jgi:tetratricopeptide (TPR) repeat protein
MCFLAQGRLDEARESIEHAVELARDNGQPGLQASWLVELGKIALASARLPDADQLARQALRLARPRDHHLTEFRAEWLRHKLLVCERPAAADQKRLAHLRRLFTQLDEHEGIEEIIEFRRTVLSPASGGAQETEA